MSGIAYGKGVCSTGARKGCRPWLLGIVLAGLAGAALLCDASLSGSAQAQTAMPSAERKMPPKKKAMSGRDKALPRPSAGKPAARPGARRPAPRPKPKSKPQTRPSPKPKPKPGVQSRPRPSQKPSGRPQTAPRPSAKPALRPQSRPKPSQKPAPRPQQKPPQKPQPKPPSRPQGKPQPIPQPAPKPSPKPEGKPAPKPAQKPASKPTPAPARPGSASDTGGSGVFPGNGQAPGGSGAGSGGAGGSGVFPGGSAAGGSGVVTCPDGRFPVLGRCVGWNAPQGHKCPPGMMPAGQTCISPPQGCAWGQTWLAGRCVDICPDGWRWENGRCIRDGRTCPWGTFLSGQACVAVCPSGSILVGFVCLPLPFAGSGPCPLPFVRSPASRRCVLPVDVIVVEKPAVCPNGWTWSAAAEGCVRLRPKMAEKDSVAWIQGCLNALGYDAGAADGIEGARTRKAWAAFRRDTGLGEKMAPLTDAETLGALYVQCAVAQGPMHGPSAADGASTAPAEDEASGLSYADVACAEGAVRVWLSETLKRQIPACAETCVPVPAGLDAEKAADAAIGRDGIDWCRHCLRLGEAGIVCPPQR